MDRSEYNERYGKGNGSFHSNSTRQMISVTRSAIYENSLREKEQKAKNYNAYGNGKYSNVGASDRLLGKPYLEPSQAVSSADKQSYYYGYYIKGNMNLKIYCDGIIPGFIKIEFFNIFNLNPEEDKLTEEQLRIRINQMLIKIGYQDSQNEKIIYDDLPEEVRNNDYYNLGYRAKSNEKSKRKH